MNDQLRRKVVIRKIWYLGVILALFTVTMFWRGLLTLPIGDANRIAMRDENGNPVELSPLDKFARLPVKYQSEDLEMRELDLGDAEIEGAVAQVSLVGSRGVVVTLLWNATINAQKRGEYHDMQFYSKLVTRLQPHFIEPWIFQAWNIAYNVSVENDKLGDAYFYIASGVSLLAEGDRLNTRTHRRGNEIYRVGSPDIRYQLGFYLQNKFTVADKVATFRSLAALSSIPPADRDPSRLTVDGSPDGRVDPVKFVEFCQKYPQLVRRLKNSLNYTTREQIVKFLRVNNEVPARYELNGTPRSDETAFPIFPVADSAHPELVSFIRNTTNRPADGIDILHAARAWFTHAQTVVPPAENKPDITPQNYDRFRYRVPSRPALIVFRMSPCRAQTYVAERLQKEGWFDANSTWDPDSDLDTRNKWFAYDGRPANDPPKQLKATMNSIEEWRVTNELWDGFGRSNGLNESDRVLQENEMNAANEELTRRTTLSNGGVSDVDIREITERFLRAKNALTYYDQNRHMTNYQFFIDQSRFESSPETAAVRQLFWNADELHKQNRIEEEIQTRVQAAASWRALLSSEAHKAYYTNDRSDILHEQTLEQEVQIAGLLQREPVVARRVDALKNALGSASPMLTLMPNDDFTRIVSMDEAQARIAAAFPLDALTQRANQLIQEVKVLNPNAKVSFEATKRELVDGEFRWLREFATPAKTERDLWVRTHIRYQYLSKIGALKPEANMPEGMVPPGGPQVIPSPDQP